jgi:GntR family transcriptional regulator
VADELDRSSPLPLWAQLADHLRRRAAEGELDERFPTEIELMHAYGVSRNTVREALRRLEDEHLVERHRGRGTALRPPPIERWLPGTYSLARTIADQGLDERSRVMAADIRLAAPEVCAVLELRGGDEVVHVERVRYAGGEPLALDRSWLPAARCRALLDADLTQGSLYEALADSCGIRVNSGWERIAPANPSQADRLVLELPRREAVFAMERLAAADGRPVEWRQSVVRGDRFRLISTWP